MNNSRLAYSTKPKTAAAYNPKHPLARWNQGLERKITYFQCRKDWARNLMKQAGLVSPGDSLEGIFNGINHKIKIGPRGGVRISEILPQLDD